MTPASQCLFLALAAFSIIRASASTILLLNSTSLDADISYGNADLDCYPAQIYRSRLAETRDCLRAVMYLPTDDEAGVFHVSGPYNHFLLPVTRIFETCNATVSITGGLEDYSSWTTISNVAAQLVATCSVGYFPTGKSGGVTGLGRDGFIRISIEKVGYVHSIARSI